MACNMQIGSDMSSQETPLEMLMKTTGGDGFQLHLQPPSL